MGIRRFAGLCRPFRRQGSVFVLALALLLPAAGDLVAAEELTIAFLPCRFQDVPGIAVIQGATGDREWSTENLRAWIDDERTGLRHYLQQELLRYSEIAPSFRIGEWRVIGPPDRYLRIDGSIMGAVHRDCAAAHADLRPAEQDITVLLTNYTFPFAGRGGGRRAILSSHISPQTIVHEILHALVLPRLGLGALLHSNTAGRDLETLPVAWANGWSAMYGNSTYTRLLDDRHGVLARPITNANRWMTNALPSAAVRWLRAPGEKTELDLWGGPETGAPLIALVPQRDGRIVTIERQPTASRYSLAAGGFASPPGSGFLLGVRYPVPVEPNSTDWAVIVDSDTIGSGWITEQALVRPGETIRVGDGTLHFGTTAVTLQSLDR
jgi:hypothetical protein